MHLDLILLRTLGLPSVGPSVTTAKHLALGIFARQHAEAFPEDGPKVLQVREPDHVNNFGDGQAGFPEELGGSLEPDVADEDVGRATGQRLEPAE